MDCDWFSNDELPPLPSFPDRTAGSGGYLPDGRGTGSAEARGTARQCPGANHFPKLGPPVGGNGSQQGQRNDREHCRGACFAGLQPGLRLAGDQSPGKDAGPSGDGSCVCPQAFRGVANIIVVVLSVSPGSQDSGSRKENRTHAQGIRFIRKAGMTRGETGGHPGLLLSREMHRHRLTRGAS